MKPAPALPHTVISIVNWYGFAHTAHCLQSIREAQFAACEVVVVDNASRDDSVARLRTEFPEVRVIQAPSNLGFAGGHQLALDHALALPGCDLFWMLNNDTRVLPETLPAFLDAYRQYGDAIYGGVPLNDDLTIEALVGIELDTDTSPARDLYFSAGSPFAEVFQDVSARRVTAVHGSNFLIPLQLARRYGFMDTAYFLYAEETDYCFRLRRLGVHCILVPNAIVFHGDSEASRAYPALSRVVRYYSTRNYLVFVRRNYGIRAYLREVSTTTLRTLRAVAQGIGQRDQSQRIDQIYALRGVFDSLIQHMGKTIAPEDYLQGTPDIG